MPGNTFGSLFRVTTWGESHGPALGAVIDGCPPNFPLSEKDIQKELDRRRPGQSAVGTSRSEDDKVKILSGVFQGKTLGTPISLIIENKDQRSKDYAKIKNLYRPGHADYAWDLKYGIRDYRGGGRSSGRETAARVMAGAIAKKYLAMKFKTRIIGHTVQVGDIEAVTFQEKAIEQNAMRCADPIKAKAMEKLVLETKKDGDSVGGIAEFIVKIPPAALGEPVFDKLQADLGKALFSIATVKGVEFGSGFQAARLHGSENNDEFICKNGKITTKTNNAGGLHGGISIGTDIIIRTAIKPASSILKSQKTVNKKGEETTVSVHGRHDACIIPRFIPVAESMIAIVIMDHLLRQKAIK
ncbi:chorismate synthase [Patescibacteria group bacterium]|nr:chorismate synthase [Patescibacteria group bacterium]MBU1702787.1 chorismate synthase [Patescibacteria group bacterium]MBU1954246.1 chorismate synthase [Patescibacteria group bacterium]